MYKLNFKLSRSTFTDINRYAETLNLRIQTVMRFLLLEQLHTSKNNPELFNKNYKKCKPKESYGYVNEYRDEVKPKSYSMVVAECIYDFVQLLMKRHNDKLNTVVNNLLHIAIKEKLSSCDKGLATPFHALDSATKQYSIPLSSTFTFKLKNISEISGIKVNQLISLIIGNYLIEHYTDYYDNDDIYRIEQVTISDKDMDAEKKYEYFSFGPW